MLKGALTTVKLLNIGVYSVRFSSSGDQHGTSPSSVVYTKHKHHKGQVATEKPLDNGQMSRYRLSVSKLLEHCRLPGGRGLG